MQSMIDSWILLDHESQPPLASMRHSPQEFKIENVRASLSFAALLWDIRLPLYIPIRLSLYLGQTIRHFSS